MRSLFRLMALLFIVLGATHCAQNGGPAPSADVAFAEMRKVLAPLDKAEEQLPILETFIRDYPDSQEALYALQDVVYFRAEELDDVDGAMEVVQGALGQIEDPELRFQVGLMAHDLSTRTGESIDLRMIADELADHRKLKFVDHLAIVEAAAETDDWQLMLEHSTAMAEYATAETFRADYPDDDFSDARVESSANRRRAWSLAYQGGALTNLGELQEAALVFEEATAFPATTNYVGVPETPINRFWGQAELMQGRPERAAELFAHDAIMGGDATALAGLKKAFVEMKGSEDGFDAYLVSSRQLIARFLDDVTLTNYSGDPVSLSSMSGKVLMISFWNPG